MARLSIAQLTTQLEQAHRAYEALAAERDSLKAQLAARPTKPTRPAYVPPPATPEQLAFRAKLAAAREQAMRTGQSVRVQ